MKLVDKTIIIAASPSEVYALLTQAELLIEWMAPIATLDARPGGEVAWTHHNGDTVRGEFVIHVVDESMAELTQQCAFPFPADVSEARTLGLATVPSTVVAPPRLSISPLSFECRVQRTERFGLYSTLFAGEVMQVHARSDLLERHRIDHHALRPLGRVAGRRYCLTRDVIEIGPEVDSAFETTAERRGC